MLLAFLSSTLFAAPLDDARAALASQAPHTLVFHKESTGQVVLEVAYHGPREASAVATSPDGTFAVSVDATHMHLRLDDGRCARIDARAAFARAREAALALQSVDGPPGSQLIYRIKPDLSVDLSTSFQRASDPPLFSWLADLGRDDVEVDASPDTWTARSSSSTWTIARASGHLQRMTVGDDALVLHEVRPPSTPAASVCPATTGPELARMLEGQLHLYACLDPLSALFSAWPTLSEERRVDAVARQTAWWRAFFAADLPGWGEQMKGAGWERELGAQVGDAAAFAGFRDQLPEAERATALARWKQGWFEQLGQQMLSAHVGELHGLMQQNLREAGAPMPPDVVAAALSGPMEQAALAEAEPVLQGVLVPFLEAHTQGLTP